MNKNKAQKIIKQLKSNFRQAETINNQLYVDTWVIGSLSELESKMRGDVYYQLASNRNLTYRVLFDDFDKYFHCVNISEHIEWETKERLLTMENINLFYQLKQCMFGKDAD